MICVLDAACRITYASPAIARIGGDDADALAGADLRQLVHADDRARFDDVYRAALADGGGADDHHCEARLGTAGGWRWYETTFRNLMANAAVAGVVGTLRDVTERQEAHERLTYEANHDALTGLANRGAFLRALEHVIRHGGPDGGRLGGDEFAAVLTGVDAARSAVAVADRPLRAMCEPVVVGGQPVVARASIGIAVADRDGVTPDEVLRQADAAMYQVKRDGTHAWRLSEPSPRT